MAGSRLIGPYAVTRASCQPASGVHSTVTMWSVKLTPNPGSARISATRSSEVGVGFGETEMSSALMGAPYFVGGQPATRAATASPISEVRRGASEPSARSASTAFSMRAAASG